MTDNDIIDLTDRPDEWKDGDDATYLWGGRPATGTLYEHAGLWHVNGTRTDNVFVLKLRVTRLAPSLPTEEGTVIRFRESGETCIAHRVGVAWFIDGNSSVFSTDRLLSRIGSASFEVASWAPLGGGRDE